MPGPIWMLNLSSTHSMIPEGISMQVAVQKFTEWTLQQVRSREEFNLRAYGSEDTVPPVYVCFIGHSMGGLVAADSALSLNAQPQKSPVIGILAFDTPYYGLNNKVFTEAAYQRAVGVAQKAADAYPYFYVPASLAYGALTAATAPSAAAAAAATSNNKRAIEDQQQPKEQQQSLWSVASTLMANNKKTGSTSTSTTSKSSTSESKWGWGSIALGVGAAVVAAGTAYAVSTHVTRGMEYVNSHFQFLGILWDNDKLKQRVESVLGLPLGFHCFYTRVQVPAGVSNSWKPASRTFVELSTVSEETQGYFSPRDCSGQDEIEAHMEMFNPEKNFDYYNMGEESVRRIGTMLQDALKRES
ncbi:hypothetical protein BGX31_002977 [Mortierella sp. GBA43]|nr:hypothetical protein BGX31_002977 [Mortierella sp. GBA43]